MSKDGLSPREIECLTLCSEGYMDQNTSALLGISARTARFHLDNAIRKLNARNRVHAVALAIRAGILREKLA